MQFVGLLALSFDPYTLADFSAGPDWRRPQPEPDRKHARSLRQRPLAGLASGAGAGTGRASGRRASRSVHAIAPSGSGGALGGCLGSCCANAVRMAPDAGRGSSADDAATILWCGRVEVAGVFCAVRVGFGGVASACGWLADRVDCGTDCWNWGTDTLWISF